MERTDKCMSTYIPTKLSKYQKQFDVNKSIRSYQTTSLRHS